VLITASQRIILYEHASEYTEAMISCMVVAGFTSATNDRVLGWFKVVPKLRSPSSGTRGRKLGRVCLLVVNLQQGGIGTVVELDTCHYEIEKMLVITAIVRHRRRRRRQVSVSSVGRWEQRKNEEKKRMKKKTLRSCTGKKKVKMEVILYDQDKKDKEDQR
jgi:hypothetical protein